MKEIKKVGAQGDIFFVRIDATEVPNEAKALPPAGGHHVVAYSDNGHHHVVSGEGTQLSEVSGDQFTRYLRIGGEFADVVHQRPFDTHETVRLGQGDWMIRRQREHTPDGFRMVED